MGTIKSLETLGYIKQAQSLRKLTVPVSFLNMIHLEKFGSKSKWKNNINFL